MVNHRKIHHNDIMEVIIILLYGLDGTHEFHHLESQQPSHHATSPFPTHSMPLAEIKTISQDIIHLVLYSIIDNITSNHNYIQTQQMDRNLHFQSIEIQNNNLELLWRRDKSESHTWLLIPIEGYLIWNTGSVRTSFCWSAESTQREVMESLRIQDFHRINWFWTIYPTDATIIINNQCVCVICTEYHNSL